MEFRKNRRKKKEKRKVQEVAQVFSPMVFLYNDSDVRANIFPCVD